MFATFVMIIFFCINDCCAFLCVHSQNKHFFSNILRIITLVMYVGMVGDRCYDF
jgi:hypothetical protein